MAGETKEKIILKGEAALELWRQGRDAWNKWVEENPVANVDFSDVDFGKERREDKHEISFEGFNFPKGVVNFSYVTFGDGNVSFSGATFGDGYVSFLGATFGDGLANFIEANFGDGDVIFDEVTFGDGNVIFSEVTFGDGDVNFYKANFGDGGVSFNRANFGDGYVDFSDATFGDGYVDFDGATFGDGHVSFLGATFGDGDVRFHEATFGDGDVRFREATFGDGNILFAYTQFNGHAQFSNLRNLEKIKSFTFEGSSFSKTLKLSYNHFPCVIDLTGTNTTNHVSLNQLNCRLRTECHWWFFQKAENVNDIASLQRLKELAEQGKDHEGALEFHAQEMRAKRWHVNTSFNGLLFDYLYDGLSNYGRSEIRPLFCLACIWLWFSCVYFINAKFSEASPLTQFIESLALSGSQILPFVANSRLTRKEGVDVLFQGDVPPLIHLAMFGQGLLSLLMLFLVGLALRNRFRI